MAQRLWIAVQNEVVPLKEEGREHEGRHAPEECRKLKLGLLLSEVFILSLSCAKAALAPPPKGSMASRSKEPQIENVWEPCLKELGIFCVKKYFTIGKYDSCLQVANGRERFLSGSWGQD